MAAAPYDGYNPMYSIAKILWLSSLVSMVPQGTMAHSFGTTALDLAMPPVPDMCTIYYCCYLYVPFQSLIFYYVMFVVTFSLPKQNY